MKIDGKAIADEILAAVKQRVTSLERVPSVRAVTVLPNAATESYLRVKTMKAIAAGMELQVVKALPNTEDVIRAIEAPGADAIIVQLPLPAGIDVDAVLAAIPPEKDADVLNKGTLLPPVAAAVAEIIARTNVEVKGKEAVVIGYGKLVGMPVEKWLLSHGANVRVITRDSGELSTLLHTADIIVSGAGSPGLVKPEMLKSGVVLIDAGTSESNGALVGDMDPACEAVASVFTPVPGGVGPIAVACLFRNAATLLTA